MNERENLSQKIMLLEEMNFIDNIDDSTDKKIEVKELVIDSKKIVSLIDSDIQECKLSLKQALFDFENEKRNFLNNTMSNTEELLVNVGGKDNASVLSNERTELSLDAINKGSFKIKNISSGHFFGFLLALFISILIFSSWVYVAHEFSSLSLNLVTLNSFYSDFIFMLEWISTLIGVENELLVGAVILGLSMLISSWLVYELYMHFKHIKNLRQAKKIYLESKEYVLMQNNSKKEILYLESYLREAIICLENFGILLDEKNATLKRIIYIEGTSNNQEKKYHPNSNQSIRDTARLLKSIKFLFDVAITKNGNFDDSSQKALSLSKVVYQDYIARIYN